MSSMIRTPNGLQLRQRMMRDLGPDRQLKGFQGIPWVREPVNVFGSDVTPAYTPVGSPLNQVQLLEYKTPQNYFSEIQGLVLSFLHGPGVGPEPLPGDIVFTVDVDRPLGITDVGYPEKDFSQILTPLGNLTQGPVWLVQFRHTNGEILRVKAYTTAHIQTGPTTFLAAAIRGWQWPYGRLD